MSLPKANQEQQTAITHGEGPLLIVAGAGTGKTSVVTRRIAWLMLEEKAKVHEVLALTFTEKAALEMEERVDRLLPYGYVDLWISTFHAFCDKVLKQHALDIGLTSDYKLLDQTQAWLLVRQNLDRFNLNYYRPLGNPSKFIHALLQHFSRCKDEGIMPDEYVRYAENIKLDSGNKDFIKQLNIEDLPVDERKELLKSEILRLEEVADAYHTYQRILHENNALDFADLINYCIKLFEERPAILHRYRQQFKYILVDEFQDTNFVQYKLIKMLAGPRNNLTVVGDDDQSIYRFRGSSITNIMQFKEDFPQAKEVILTKNYRSQQAILDKAYDFIKQNNPNRLEEKLSIQKKLQSQVGKKGQVSHLHFDSVENESRGVVNKILELKEADSEATWSDFAILVRANDSALQFTNVLAQANVPYQFLALKGLYHKTVVIDIVSYLKVIENYHLDTAFFRLLNLPFLAIKPLEVTKLVHFARQKSLSLFEVARQAGVVPGIGVDSVKAIQKLISRVEKDTVLAQNKKSSEVFLSFMYYSGYLDYLKSLSEKDSQEQLGHVQQFYQKVQSFEAANPEGQLNDFVAVMDMEMEAGEAGNLQFNPDAGPDMVRVMTVHTAKGLEFKYVFVVNLVDRKFPTDERKEKIQIPEQLIKDKAPEEGDFHLEEERRLFYVAMTRAKEALFLTSAKDYGGVREKKLSRFLVEMGFERDKPTTRMSAVGDQAKSSAGKPSENPGKNVYLPKFFSFSSLSSYDKCPYQFYFGKVLRIPTFGRAAFTYGDVMHRTLKDFLEESFAVSSRHQADLFGGGQGQESVSKLLPLENLLNIYEKNWSDDWYPDKATKEKYYKKGRAELKDFYADFTETKPRVKMLEQPFQWRLKQFKIVGRIDRIDEIEDGIEIIDYKTGTPKGDKLSSEDKRQLVLYHIAAEEVLGLRAVKLTYHYLEGNKKVSFSASDKDIQKLKLKLLESIRGIQEGDFTPAPNPFVCKYCDFKDICDFRKL